MTNAKWIRDHRSAAGLSQAELAAKVGVTKALVNQWEQGTAMYDPESVKTGYEISFTRYFDKPKSLRTLEEIRAEILALERGRGTADRDHLEAGWVVIRRKRNA